MQDEFIHLQQPDTTLEAAVESLLGDEYASLLLDTLLYPRTCQAGSIAGDDLEDLPSNTSLAETSHLFDATYPRYEFPKSIINPRRCIEFEVRPSKFTMSLSPVLPKAARCGLVTRQYLSKMLQPGSDAGP